MSNPVGRPAQAGSKQRFIVTLPEEIAHEVRRLAGENKRTVTAQFEWMIEEWLRQEALTAA